MKALSFLPGLSRVPALRALGALPALSEKQQRYLMWAAVPAFYVFCLLLFVRLTFPYDTLKDRILTEFNTSQSERVLYIDSLSGSGLFGVELVGVRLEEVPLDKASAEPPPAVSVDSLDLSVSLLRYLFGALSVDFEADVGGGSIEGEFFQDDARAQLAVVGDGVDISGLTLLSKSVGLPLGGVLSGKLELLLPERRAGKATGAFDVTIDGLTVGDGKAKVRNTLALPKISAGSFRLRADVTDGRLEVSEFGCDGRDFEMTGSGKVRLRQEFDKSVADLDIAFRFKEAYRGQSDLTRSLFGSPDSKIPALFDMDPMVRRAKSEDGFYRWKVAGLLGSPSFRPGRPSPTTKGLKGPK